MGLAILYLLQLIVLMLGFLDGVGLIRVNGYVFCLSGLLSLFLSAFILRSRRKQVENRSDESANNESAEIRRQRHAFGNKLQVIYGLVQLGDSERVKEYIKGLDLKNLGEDDT